MTLVMFNRQRVRLPFEVNRDIIQLERTKGGSIPYAST
jgi:hypothetical protein